MEMKCQVLWKELVFQHSPKVVNKFIFFFSSIILNLWIFNMFDVFPSVVILLFFNVEVVPCLGSESLFNLAPTSNP